MTLVILQEVTEYFNDVSTKCRGGMELVSEYNRIMSAVAAEMQRKYTLGSAIDLVLSRMGPYRSPVIIAPTVVPTPAPSALTDPSTQVCLNFQNGRCNNRACPRRHEYAVCKNCFNRHERGLCPLNRARRERRHDDRRDDYYRRHDRYGDRKEYRRNNDRERDQRRYRRR